MRFEHHYLPESGISVYLPRGWQKQPQQGDFLQFDAPLHGIYTPNLIVRLAQKQALYEGLPEREDFERYFPLEPGAEPMFSQERRIGGYPAFLRVYTVVSADHYGVRLTCLRLLVQAVEFSFDFTLSVGEDLVEQHREIFAAIFNSLRIYNGDGWGHRAEPQPLPDWCSYLDPKFNLLLLMPGVFAPQYNEDGQSLIFFAPTEQDFNARLRFSVGADSNMNLQNLQALVAATNNFMPQTFPHYQITSERPILIQADAFPAYIRTFSWLDVANGNLAMSNWQAFVLAGPNLFCEFDGTCRRELEAKYFPVFEQALREARFKDAQPWPGPVEETDRILKDWMLTDLAAATVRLAQANSVRTSV